MNCSTGLPSSAPDIITRQIGPGTSPPKTLPYDWPPIVMPDIFRLCAGSPTHTAPAMFGV